MYGKKDAGKGEPFINSSTPKANPTMVNKDKTRKGGGKGGPVRHGPTEVKYRGSGD